MRESETPVGNSTPSKASLLGLDGLNFLLADVRDGVGPFLSVYPKGANIGKPDKLASRWQPARWRRPCVKFRQDCWWIRYAPSAVWWPFLVCWLRWAASQLYCFPIF